MIGLKRVTVESDGDGRYDLLHENDALTIWGDSPVLIAQWRGHSFLINDEEETEAKRLQEAAAHAIHEYHGFLHALERRSPR